MTTKRIHRPFAATLLVASAGAIAASIIGPASVANAFPAHLYSVKGYADCVKNAEAISVPGHDDNALKASCCASMGGFMFGPPGNETCVTEGVGAADTTKTPGAVIAVGHGPDPARLAN